MAVVGNIIKNGRPHVLEMANRASVQKLTNESVSGITGRLDNHESGLNTNAHGISNISGLKETLIDMTVWINNLEDKDVILSDNIGELETNKQDAFTGYTGSITVITEVNFSAQTIITKTVTMTNGVVTSIS